MTLAHIFASIFFVPAILGAVAAAASSAWGVFFGNYGIRDDSPFNLGAWWFTAGVLTASYGSLMGWW